MERNSLDPRENATRVFKAAGFQTSDLIVQRVIAQIVSDTDGVKLIQTLSVQDSLQENFLRELSAKLEETNKVAASGKTSNTSLTTLLNRIGSSLETTANRLVNVENSLKDHSQTQNRVGNTEKWNNWMFLFALASVLYGVLVTFLLIEMRH